MPDELRVIIVDDEEPARRLLREYLGRMTGVSIVAECGNGFEAVKAVGEHDPDVMLLDIQMPKLDGFEVLELLERDLPIVFITAHDQHALRAFEVHAVDYLLKPFGAERLGEALERARERIGRAGENPSVEELIASARPEEGYLERILVLSSFTVDLSQKSHKVRSCRFHADRSPTIQPLVYQLHSSIMITLNRHSPAFQSTCPA